MNITAQERADSRRDDYYDRSNGYRALRAVRSTDAYEISQRLVAGYRKLESELQPLADSHLSDFEKRVRPPRDPSVAKAAVSATSIRRKPGKG